MKSNEIYKIKFIGNRYVPILALVFGIWLGAGTTSLFGFVGIGASTDSDCSGSATVFGQVFCFGCEGVPAVWIDSGHGGEPSLPTVSGDCYDGYYYGDYSETTVYLNKGVNIITASDSCGGSASVKIISSGGSGAGFEFLVTPACPNPNGPGCGAEVTFIFTCLTGGHSYNWHEDVSGGNTCITPTVLHSDKPINPPSGYSIGVLHDSAAGPCPSVITASWQVSTCTGTITQDWYLTDTTGGGSTVVASGQTVRNYTIDPYPKIIVDVSGVTVGCTNSP